MKLKIQLTESKLKQMVIRAINESLLEFEREEFQPTDITSEGWAAIVNWAVKVRQGMDYRDNRIYGPFLSALINNAKLKYVVLKAFGYENTEISTMNGDETVKDQNGNDVLDKKGNPRMVRIDNPNKPPLDTYRMCEDGMDEDVINEFFSGISQLGDRSNTSDAFPGYTEGHYNKQNKWVEGYNLDIFVKIILSKEDNRLVFIHKLSNLLGFYARHYFRKHYEENVIHYGIGSKSMDALEPKKYNYDSGDYEADAISDTDVTDELGATVNSSNDDIRFKGDDITSTSGNATNDKMLRQVMKIINNNDVKLTPQEKSVLQCVVNICKTGVNSDRLEKMFTNNTTDDLSDTQKNQVIYDEIAERLNIPIDAVKKTISSAKIKARQSRYAKLDEQRKQKLNQLINEVIRKIMKKYLV